MAVHRDGPAGDVVETGEQAEDGALAAAARPDEGDRLARRYGEADVVEMELVPGVAEAHIREPNLPCQARERARPRRVDHAGALAQQVFDALQTPGGGEEARDDLLAQVVGVLVHAGEQADERDQRADRHLAVERQHRPHPQGHQLHQEDAEAGGRPDQLGKETCPDGVPREARKLVPEASEGGRLQPKDLDDRLGANVLVDGAGELPLGLL